MNLRQVPLDGADRVPLLANPNSISNAGVGPLNQGLNIDGVGASERSQDEQGVSQTTRGHLNDQDAHPFETTYHINGKRLKSQGGPIRRRPGIGKEVKNPDRFWLSHRHRRQRKDRAGREGKEWGNRGLERGLRSQRHCNPVRSLGSIGS